MSTSTSTFSAVVNPPVVDPYGRTLDDPSLSSEDRRAATEVCGVEGWLRACMAAPTPPMWAELASLAFARCGGRIADGDDALRIVAAAAALAARCGGVTPRLRTEEADREALNTMGPFVAAYVTCGDTLIGLSYDWGYVQIEGPRARSVLARGRAASDANVGCGVGGTERPRSEFEPSEQVVAAARAEQVADYLLRIQRAAPGAASPAEIETLRALALGESDRGLPSRGRCPAVTTAEDAVDALWEEAESADRRGGASW